LQQLNDNNQVVLRYVDANGDAENVNGSAQNIAGIINKEGNVMGLMPHPERVCDAQIGGIDGRKIFTSLMVA
jgi:phosphoribosylformylglycinamidine synthase